MESQPLTLEQLAERLAKVEADLELVSVLAQVMAASLWGKDLAKALGPEQAKRMTDNFERVRAKLGS